jgi:NitT/TauT family transport system ATP-binding protein
VELAGLPLDERRRKGPARAQLVDTIYHIMTNPTEDAALLVEQRSARPGARAVPELRSGRTKRRYQTLPDVGIDDLTGFVQYLSGIGGTASLQDLSRDLQMRADDLRGLVEATDLLGLADMQERQVFLTPIGQEFAEVELDAEKEIFRRVAMEHISLLRHIVRELEDAPSHSIEAEGVLDDLEHSFSGGEARRQFETVVDWGRYAELFTYDDKAGELRLDEEHRMDFRQGLGEQHE